MARLRTWLTHLTAFAAGAAIAGPFALAFGHTEKGIEAGDWLNLPNSVIGAIIGGLLTYFLQPKPQIRGGRPAVDKAIRAMREVTERVGRLAPERISDDAILSEALAIDSQLTATADRYQYARALTPPEETVREWIDVDAAVLVVKSGLRDFERGLPGLMATEGADFVRRHLVEVRDNLSEPLRRVLDRVAP